MSGRGSELAARAMSARLQAPRVADLALLPACPERVPCCSNVIDPELNWQHKPCPRPGRFLVCFILPFLYFSKKRSPNAKAHARSHLTHCLLAERTGNRSSAGPAPQATGRRVSRGASAVQTPGRVSLHLRGFHKNREGETSVFFL